MLVFGKCQCSYQYLLGKALCVLQAVCEGLDEEVAAGLTQSIVVLTFLAGLGQQSQPDLGHRVTTGLLPKHMQRRKGKHRDKLFVKYSQECFTTASPNEPLVKLVHYAHRCLYLLILEVNRSASFSSERAYSLSISPRRRR